MLLESSITAFPVPLRWRTRLRLLFGAPLQVQIQGRVPFFSLTVGPQVMFHCGIDTARTFATGLHTLETMRGRADGVVGAPERDLQK